MTSGLFYDQAALMSRGFCRTALVGDWASGRRSPWVGCSAACYVAPALWCAGCGPVFRAAWLAQAAASYASDFVWSGVPHWSHGVDRWLSTAMVCVTALLGSARLGVGACAVLAAPPLFCLRCSKRSRTWPGYELWHTLWHVVGAASACAALGS